ncbi:hypothetical protein K470DRAFT_299868 [Piedraia hortae CBS 480.64]|uniref:Uncharacterized protein n=1 Tax=Piedraia hortae CBS 480.64 TaxID=1314780 RepID=A0A6A7BY93_9PEZI|nr:hypothetical protein K470DRAFT_299868 [Piedraia hortae CBS 480.64]
MLHVPRVSRHDRLDVTLTTEKDGFQTAFKRSLSAFQIRTIHQPQRQQADVRLDPNRLVHSFSHSPVPAIRRRAQVMRNNALCPHPEHHGQASHVRYECPDCGFPLYCSVEHFADEYAAHVHICDLMRQINEDDHDLYSGRVFTEFDYPGRGLEEAPVNMTNWDTLLYSRDFLAIDELRPLRHVTRLLTYPMTIGSVLHELSPYDLRTGLTKEGLRSFSALRYTLHPPPSGAGKTVAELRPTPPPVRVFVLGARAESSLPRDVWLQLSYLFNRATFHLVFIGPESMLNREQELAGREVSEQGSFHPIVEDRLGAQMKISTYTEYFHTLHNAQHFHPYDPYFDCFVLFHPGLGHPASSHEWASTLPQLLETKVPVICTGYTNADMSRDIAWVKEQARGEADILLKPRENLFRSLRWEVNDLDPHDLNCGNWGVWAFRGKRYETQEYSGKDEKDEWNRV